MKLEEILNDFDRRIRGIETQLSALERGRSAIADHAAEQGSNDVNSTTVVQSKSRAPRYRIDNAFVSPTRVPLSSSSVLGTIGIIFVILAGVFFLKITIDSGWLTPIRQIFLAAATGLGFFLAPHFFPKAEKEYGALLAGAGTAILHATWLGAYAYHHVLNENLALICATAVGVFSILANLSNGNRVYLLVALAGTYLSAPIIGYSTGYFPGICLFLVIWNISFSAAALMNKSRDVIFIAGFYAIFAVLLLTGRFVNHDQQLQLLYLQIFQFVFFTLVMLAYSFFHETPLTNEESVAVLPLLLLFYISTFHLLSALSPALAPWFGVAVGSFVILIYFGARKIIPGELTSAPSLSTFASLAIVHSAYFQLTEESWQPLVSLALAAIVFKIWSSSDTARKKFFWPLLIFLATTVHGAILTVLLSESIGPIYIYNWLFGMAAIGAVVYVRSPIAEKNGAGAEKAMRGSAPVLLGFGHFEMLLGLYRLSLHLSFGALFVTFTWGLYALIVLAGAYFRKDKMLGNSALTILLAVSLKAFFYDVSETGNLTRVLCLLAEGLLLYCCGWIFKKMRDWEADASPKSS